MDVATTCPSRELLQQLLLGEVSDSAAEQLEQHLEGCERCGRLLPTLEKDDALVVAMRAQATVSLKRSEMDTLTHLLPRLLELPALVRSTGAAKQEEGSDNRPRSRAGAGTSVANVTELFGPPEQPDEIGRLHPYRVLKLLGSGGMGAVFAAEDLQLKRPVALKIMLPAVAREQSARERFLREARAAATVEHEHIVTVYQVGEDRGVPFLAMQLLKGHSLEDLFASQSTPGATRLNLAQALRIGREIAVGLAAAHARGLVHRDIKPSNIWLEQFPENRVKILDFGLARSADEDSQLTQLNTFVGSPAYTAPEQARGRQVDARSDLFSLGCVLYRLFTGQLPWQAPDAMGTLIAVATEQPIPPRDLNPELPIKLVRLIMQLLAKRPEQRPQSAAVVAAQLEVLLRELPRKALKQPLPLAGESRIAAGRPLRRSVSWPPRVASLAAAFLLLCCAVMIFVQTDAGTLQIEAADHDVNVIIEQGGREVEVVDTRTGATVRLHSGEYRLRLGADQPHVRLDKDSVRIVRGDTVVARITAVPVTTAAPTATSPIQADAPSGKVPATAEIINSLGMRLAAIPAGKFRMGSPMSEPSRRDDELPHEVIITQPFFLGATLVTLGQFRRFVDGSGFRPEGGDNWRPTDPQQTDAFPVGNVSWNDAMAFCNWLSKQEHRQYHLPTEAEWEYACRAGSQEMWCFGSKVEQLGEYAWYSANSGMKPHAVALLRPNAWGLYDVHGNLWQWTNDWYAADYYQHSPEKDPQGPASGTGKVLRGGSFYLRADSTRCAARHNGHEPSWRKAHVGFRVAMNAPTELGPSPPEPAK